jgi:hypothetical protein
MTMLRFSSFAALLVVLLPAPASAANILVVSDANTDTNIATVLRADGHTVNLVTFDYMSGLNPTLRGDLSEYDAVFWSATANGFGGVHASPEVFTNLTDYVSSGGRVFVTGYNCIASPDSLLISFLGGTGANGFPGSPSTVASIDTSMTTGAVDIRGIAPTQYSFDLDGLLGLGPDTTEIVGSLSGPFGGGGGAQWTLRTIGSGEIAFVSNGDFMTAEPFSWAAAMPGSGGAYNAVIRNFAAASEGSASSPGAPRVRFVSASSAEEGAEIEIMVEITDEEGDPYTFSWDLDDDGTFGERPDLTSYTIPAGTTDGDGSVRVSIEASDGTNVTTRTRTIRIANVAPRITTEPPTRVSVDQIIRYTIGVDDPAGEADTVSFTMVRGPSSSDVTPEGVFRWIPGESDVTTPTRTTRVIIDVSDEDGGTTTHEWEVVVSPNHAPSMLQAVYPIAAIAIIDPTPRLAVQNATDVDGDTLTYRYEIDSVPTYDSPDRMESGPIDQTAGFTAWQLTTPLHVGRWHWRAWVSDGDAEIGPTEAEFYVVVDPATIPDGGPPDATVVGTDAGPTETGGRGCTCRVAPRAGAPRAALAGLALGLAALWTRRRR